jgi:hypothetical protein
MQRVCVNCEYFDCGGFKSDWVPRSHEGDCLNRLSPRFQTTAERTCDKFYPDSIRFPQAEA